ncbi:transcription antitermination factor NusB [Candidatus Campbellbacteria bacterium]|nr:MAG: transcription antitermination factor NusB [Candidatus Campbellbacteria bacterium]
MLTRNNSRQLALQTMFVLDTRFFGLDYQENQNLDTDKISEVYSYVFENFYKDKSSGEDEFSKNLIFGVVKNLEEIDQYIQKFAKNWSLEKTAIVDKNILRIAIYELLFFESELPGKVVINEAIELAKKYGHKKSHLFISGLLGALYENMGLEKKDQKLNSLPKKITEKKKVGALCFYKKEGKIKYLLVHNIFGKWTLPKGSVEQDFDNINDALNSILKSKVNVEGKAGDIIGKNEYSSLKDVRNIVKKDIVYFIFEVSNPGETEVKQKNGGLNNVKWFTEENLKKAQTYEDLEEIIQKGVELIKKQNV